jgi:hypothetical protein
MQLKLKFKFNLKLNLGCTYRLTWSGYLGLTPSAVPSRGTGAALGPIGKLGDVGVGTRGAGVLKIEGIR